MLGDSKSTTNQSDSRLGAETSGELSPTMQARGEKNVNNTGQLNYNNQSGGANASGGGTIVSGKGATLSIVNNDLSADVANRALDTNGMIAKMAMTTTGDLAKASLSTMSDFGTKMAEISASSTESIAGQNAAILGAVTDLGKTVSTAGQSDTNRTILFMSAIGAIVVGVLAWAFMKR